MHESGDLAVTVGMERGTAVVDGGEPFEMEIRTTHVYRREDGEWKLVHRHADFPPPDQRTRPIARCGPLELGGLATSSTAVKPVCFDAIACERARRRRAHGGAVGSARRAPTNRTLTSQPDRHRGGQARGEPQNAEELALARRISSPEFVGRRDELQILSDALESAGAGEARTVLVAGESGVGKSRLLAEFEALARAADARVAVGACLDLGGDSELPYSPIVEVLRGLLADVDLDDLEDVLAVGRGELARLLPELAGGETAEGPPGEQSQSRLFGLLLRLLGRMAEDTPVVIIAEDLHWADTSSREFLTFLVRNARRQRLLLAGTYRSDELHRSHPLRRVVAALERDSRVERVKLQPFSRLEIDAQLAAILGEPADPRLAGELFERSEGNPFFAEELLAASGDQGAAWLPETLRDTLILRVEGLSEPTQRVLRVAAVAGSRVGHELLAAAAGAPEHDLLEALREAVGHNVLVYDRESGDYAFRHALLREALYDDLLPGERAALHAALAAALESDRSLSAAAHGATAELAFHWNAANRVAPALAASVEAGREAARVYAFGEAHRHFARALELWDGVAEGERPPGLALVDVMREAAETADLAGDYDRAIALGRRVLDVLGPVADSFDLAQAHERLAKYLADNGAMELGLEALREALRLLPEEPPSAERARVLNAEAQVRAHIFARGEAVRECCEEAIRLARAVGARAEEASSRITLGIALYFLSDDDAAIEQVREGRRLAQEIGLVEELWRGYLNLGHILDGAGRIDEAIAEALEGREVAFRHGMQPEAGLLVSEAAQRLMRRGRWDEAQELMRETVESRPTGLYGSMVLEVQAALDLDRGDFELAAARLRQVRQLSRGATGPMSLAPLYAAEANLALWRGRPEDVRALADEAPARLEPGDEVDHFLAVFFAAAVRAEADLASRARSLGQPAQDAEDRAQALVRDFARHAEAAARPLTLERATLAEQCAREAERARATDTAEGWAALAGRWGSRAGRTRPPTPAGARPRSGSTAAVTAPAPRPPCARRRTSLAGSAPGRCSSSSRDSRRAPVSTSGPRTPPARPTRGSTSGSRHARPRCCGCWPRD